MSGRSSPPDTVLLDTHALLWWQAGSERLSAAAGDAIRTAGRVLVSPISFWEVAMLVAKGRVALDRPVAAWAHDVLATVVARADLDPHVAVSAGGLPDFHGDPADRLIWATAHHLAVPLVTRDARMTARAERDRGVTIVW